MRIAVYTIALNEEKHVKKWYESAKEADYLLIADTGSTDKTVEIAKSLGINVIDIRIDPWRFDDARNASLAAIPLDIDYCIALDMDEVLIDGWKKDFPKVLELGITRPVYEYVHGWSDDGTAALTLMVQRSTPVEDTGGDIQSTRQSVLIRFLRLEQR
jgi:glycosyltransferase involved in cell wall biosynthesis